MTTATPCRDALHAATARAEELETARAAAEETWMADDDAPNGDETAPTRLAYVASTAASNEADRAVETAKAALLQSDEVQTYTLRDRDGSEEDIEAVDMAAAKVAAREWAEGGDWNEPDGTIWIYVSIVGEAGDEGSISVAVNPKEPRCDGEHDHDWQSPHAIVGGLEENPGVHGHGGGVIITEVCMHCGCERVTDTWAQDMSTGEQGLESVAYEAGKYEGEVRAMREEDAA